MCKGATKNQSLIRIALYPLLLTHIYKINKMKKQLTLCVITLLSTAITSGTAFASPQQKGQYNYLKRFITKFDSNNDTVVTKAEYDASMEQRYKAIDTDRNGEISKEEFKNSAQSMRHDRKKTTKDKKKSNFDSNNDGLVSKKEYLAAKQKRAEKKFAKLDKDGDGLLTKSELSAKKYRSGSKKSRDYFPKIDTNNDGIISREESKASSARLFKHLDTNNDLVITQDEIQALSEKRRMKK